MQRSAAQYYGKTEFGQFHFADGVISFGFGPPSADKKAATETRNTRKLFEKFRAFHASVAIRFDLKGMGSANTLHHHLAV